jgi:hypothetical protein
MAGFRWAGLLVALSPARRYEWGHHCDPEMDKLFEAIRNTFDPAEQAKVLRKTHEKYVDEALFLMHARRQSLRHDREGEGLCPGEELVPEPLID